LNNDNSYGSEQYWSVSGDSNGQSGGYGTTYLEAEPLYQVGVQSSGKRAFPDVSFDAANNSEVFTYTSATTSPWLADGGTSLAAPCWATLLAIANQERVTPGGAGAPFVNSTAALTALYDIPRSDYNQTTGAQYDPGTGASYNGLGTPKANEVVQDLGTWKAVGLPSGSIAVGTAGSTYNQSIVASGGTGRSSLVVTPGWAKYPVGLTFDNSTNNTLSITGTPSAAGTYPFSVTVTDSNGFTATQGYILTINPLDVSGQVGVSRSGLVYDRSTKLFNGSLTITNDSPASISGSIGILLQGLTGGASLANATVTVGSVPYALTVSTDSAGDPYVTIPETVLAALAPKQSLAISLQFKDPTLALIGFKPQIFSGTYVS
jgi:hypothetical protein